MTSPSSHRTATEQLQGVCPHCGAAVLVHERFCEVCGSPLAGTGPTAPPSQAAVPRAELIAGAAAAVSDLGLRRRRNEDAVAMTVAGDGVVVALCDGVASTANAHHASDRASIAALRSLERGASAVGSSVPELLGAAFRSAQEAVCTVRDDDAAGRELSPSTTMVAAVTSPGAVAVGNVGDSRAYWLSASAQRRLTVDDSWAEELVAEGTPREEAYADPEAHTITRWLGPDATSVELTITTFEVLEPGLLVLCSDGLWNYFEQAERLAPQLGLTEGTSSLILAHRLVDAALAEGGHDNVTVAVIPVAPLPTTASVSEE